MASEIQGQESERLKVMGFKLGLVNFWILEIDSVVVVPVEYLDSR